jgi:hypothetical protein
VAPFYRCRREKNQQKSYLSTFVIIYSLPSEDNPHTSPQGISRWLRELCVAHWLKKEK